MQKKDYRMHTKLSIANNKLYNTHEHLYDSNGQDRILQRLICHTLNQEYILIQYHHREGDVYRKSSRGNF